MIVLEGRDLTKVYGRHKTAFHALRGVSFRLKDGEILGLAGESGSGKSTILKLISGLEPPTSGSILLHGRELSPRRTKEEYRTMQMIFQSATASFHPRRTIADSITESVRTLRGKNASVDFAALADLVGLPAVLMERYPRQLSGGQCQRMAIARAMAAEPEILLCDEITSALDVSSQAQILRLLAEICRKKHTSAIFVSHDLAVIRCLCDRVTILRGGALIEEGEVAQVIGAPKEAYTRKLVDSVLEI
ncbi:MAG: ATP-binding cassette domain-containing protein [Oscillospiraceae bacterium]|nr:ATP-binding cassette domain-containing protein [Oscillospiraceae bacterium]